MIGTEIKIEGLREMERALTELGAQLGASTLRSAMKDAAVPFFEYMQQHAPVGDYGERTVKTKKGGKVTIRQGFMRSRVKIRTSLNKRGKASKRFDENTTAIVRVGVFKVPYVVPVEYGNSKSPAQSFIRPAMTKAEQALAIFKAQLQIRIEMARRKVARSPK